LGQGITLGHKQRGRDRRPTTDDAKGAKAAMGPRATTDDTRSAQMAQGSSSSHKAHFDSELLLPYRIDAHGVKEMGLPINVEDCTKLGVAMAQLMDGTNLELNDPPCVACSRCSRGLVEGERGRATCGRAATSNRGTS
jgi:hypothetical protein